MKKVLLKLGAEGGEVALTSIKINDVESFEVNVSEIFDVDDQTATFSTKDLAWRYFQKRVKSWQVLYPLTISAEIRPLVQKAFNYDNANEFNQDQWKYHLNLCRYTSRSLPDIVVLINNNADIILGKLEHESFETYLFISENYKSNVTENYFFQFVFRSFYRLDGGGLSPEIKQTFFELFEEYKQVDFSKNWNQALSNIVEEIYKIPSLQFPNTVQFSFATKLLNTLNNAVPIYDSEVQKVFGFAGFYSPDYKKRLERMLIYHGVISKAYTDIINSGLLDRIIDKLDLKFPMYNHIPQIKKLDFIFWAAGKVITTFGKTKQRT